VSCVLELAIIVKVQVNIVSLAIAAAFWRVDVLMKCAVHADRCQADYTEYQLDHTQTTQ